MPNKTDVQNEPLTATDPDAIVIHRPKLVIVSGILALVLAIFIATQIVGVLYALVFPPTPPLPPDVTQLEHHNGAYGVDDWLYGIDQDACAILDFYEEEGGVCHRTPSICAGDLISGVTSPGQTVGSCWAHIPFSIFALRWEVNIATGYRSDGRTQFRLSREIFWTGPGPEPTS